MIRVLSVATLAAALSGCVTTETVQFKQANPQQQAITRDGRPSLVSHQRNSIVMVRPVERQIAVGGRPAFVVGIYNLAKGPLDFRVSDVQVAQNFNGQSYPMQVISYEMLAQEEKNRQVAAAILTGVAAGANSYAASRAGHGSFSTTTHGRHGAYTTHGSFYSPAAAAIAQNNASIQNAAMIDSVVNQGQQNMAALEAAVIKDNTLLPGEWYGGSLHLSPPNNPPSGSQKSYSLTIAVGPDRHTIDISQGPAQ